MSYLGLSVPLVVVIEPESELAINIIESGIGYCTDGTEIADITSMFRNMLSSPESHKAYKLNAKKYYGENCCRRKILNRWSLLVGNLS